MRLLWVAAVLLLAGCAGPPVVPSDAQTETAEGLPGLTMSAWVEHRRGFTYLHAVVENQGSATYETKEDCGYLWQSELAQNDTPVAYARDPERVCDWVYDFLRPGEWREFLYSWDGRVWNGTGASPAAEGDYTWTVRFLLRDGTDHATQTPLAGRYLEATISFSR